MAKKSQKEGRQETGEEEGCRRRRRPRRKRLRPRKAAPSARLRRRSRRRLRRRPRRCRRRARHSRSASLSGPRSRAARDGEGGSFGGRPCRLWSTLWRASTAGDGRRRRRPRTSRRSRRRWRGQSRRRARGGHAACGATATAASSTAARIDVTGRRARDVARSLGDADRRRAAEATPLATTVGVGVRRSAGALPIYEALRGRRASRCAGDGCCGSPTARALRRRMRALVRRYRSSSTRDASSALRRAGSTRTRRVLPPECVTVPGARLGRLAHELAQRCSRRRPAPRRARSSGGRRAWRRRAASRSSTGAARRQADDHVGAGHVARVQPQIVAAARPGR